MDDEDVAAKIRAECMTGDYEGDHGRADDILRDLLRELGYEQTLTAYDAVGKWYA
jgi:hypothetical protein